MCEILLFCEICHHRPPHMHTHAHTCTHTHLEVYHADGGTAGRDARNLVLANSHTHQPKHGGTYAGPQHQTCGWRTHLVHAMPSNDLHSGWQLGTEHLSILVSQVRHTNTTENPTHTSPYRKLDGLHWGTGFLLLLQLLLCLLLL